MLPPLARMARHLFVAIPLLFATLTVLGQSLPPYPPSWKLLYQSDFAAGTLSDWTMTMDPNLNGTWAIVPDGANSVLEGANNATIELVQRPFSGFFARFRLRLTGGGGLIVFFRQQNCARNWASFNENTVSVSRRNGCSGNTDFSAPGTLEADWRPADGRLWSSS